MFISGNYTTSYGSRDASDALTTAEIEDIVGHEHIRLQRNKRLKVMILDNNLIAHLSTNENCLPLGTNSIKSPQNITKQNQLKISNLKCAKCKFMNCQNKNTSEMVTAVSY